MSDNSIHALEKQFLGANRAAINLYLGILIYGSIAAFIIVFLPFIVIYSVVFGWPPPPPTNLVLRIVQVIQGFVIGYAGSMIMSRSFRRKYVVRVQEVRMAMKRIAVVIPVCFILIILMISIPKYGISIALIINGTIIFGATAFFIIYFGFKSLGRLDNSD